MNPHQAITKIEASLGHLRVLVVEDNREARLLVRNMLQDFGLSQIFEANSGREGLHFIDLAPEMVDLIICDWNMPDMDGLSLLKQIRTVFANMPFLMLTGRCDLDSVHEAKSAGVSAYIRKPFSPNQLEAKLRIMQGFG
jgi:CheY-like chemotaxis protein